AITKVYCSLEHFHPRNESKILRLEINEKLKQCAIDSKETFDSALFNATVDYSEDQLKNIGNINNIRDYYTRLRRNSKTPIVKHDEDILDMYKYTYDGAKFLQDDTGKNDDSRIIIFYREEHLLLIKRTDCILCDGTFKAAPRGFSQLFVVHIMFFKKRIPILYAFTKRKDYETYKYIFEHLKNIVSDFNGFIITDFEYGLSKAIKNVFPNSRTCGCNFHFSQILWRKIQDLKLILFYRKNEKFKKIFKYLIMLSYVPIENIFVEFQKINHWLKIQKKSVRFY
ncbi:hypothetical protein DMUE_5990, partial [Dictyocoela muelleri]